MNHNAINLVIASFAALALAAGALAITMILGNNSLTGFVPAEILSGGILGAAFLLFFSPRNGIAGAAITVAMVASALALFVGGMAVMLGGAIATGAWAVSAWLSVATCQAYLRMNSKSR